MINPFPLILGTVIVALMQVIFFSKSILTSVLRHL